MKRAMLVVLALLGAVAGAAQAEELGRLFFTPEQRQALDARRKARVPDKPAAAAVVSPTVRLDGYVKRSGGRSTVFVNGEPTEDSPRIPDTSDGRVSVSTGEGGPRVPLKPGQTLDRGSNEVRDGIGDGRIRVRPESR